MAWIFQLAMALNYLHEQPHPILHRDIKQANVFLDGRYGVKLGDFGLARTLSSESQLAQTVCIGKCFGSVNDAMYGVQACGTPYYLSPELCLGQPYDSKSDCWALGCLLYEMMTLKRPFHVICCFVFYMVTE
jgi:NIMA (never in mitosis gene a)-related kinase